MAGVFLVEGSKNHHGSYWHHNFLGTFAIYCAQAPFSCLKNLAEALVMWCLSKRLQVWPVATLPHFLGIVDRVPRFLTRILAYVS